MPKLQSVFLPSQLEELHKSYESAIILTKKSRSELIKLTGLSSTQVNNWFKNKRKQLANVTNNPKQNIDDYVSNEELTRLMGEECDFDSTQLFELCETENIPENIQANTSSKSVKSLSYCPNQLDALHEAFEEANYINKKSQMELVDRTGLSTAQINQWFKNKRRRIEPAGLDPADLTSSLTSKDRINTYSPEQLNELKISFEQSNYLNTNDCSDLVERTGLSIIQINNWFKNRRRHEKQTTLGAPIRKFVTTTGLTAVTRFTQIQLAELNRWFKKSKYIDENDRSEIVNRTGLTFKQISNWFKKKRSATKDDEVSLINNYSSITSQNNNAVAFEQYAEQSVDDVQLPTPDIEYIFEDDESYNQSEFEVEDQNYSSNLAWHFLRDEIFDQGKLKLFFYKCTFIPAF